MIWNYIPGKTLFTLFALLLIGLLKNQSINPILIRVYPRKRGWLDLPHSNSNLSKSHSPSCSIQGILLLQTNTLALVLYLRLPRLLWSSLLPLVLHFKLQHFSQNMPSALLNTCLYQFLTPFAFAIWTTLPSIPTPQ